MRWIDRYMPRWLMVTTLAWIWGLAMFMTCLESRPAPEYPDAGTDTRVEATR